MSFSPQHNKFIRDLENPGLNVAQQLVRTAGKGSGNSYTPPSDDIIAKTRALFTSLHAFDAAPNDLTFAQVKNALTNLNMKAVQVDGAPEWIYITPDAEPGTTKWEEYSKKTQFNLSWHIGCDSKAAISDEHNGGDGSFRAVGELVEQGTNIKLVMSNSRDKRTSKRNASNHYIADWAHSKATIDYPIMCDLARQGYYVINIHGMASRDYGLLVNNYDAFFTRDRESLPTMIGIALALYFNDSDHKKFRFGGNLPGSANINGIRKPLTAPNNEISSADSLYIRAKGVHNTNVIGNAVNSINARMANRAPGDSGKSCHIEFGIIRDGRADLRKMIAAINLAAFWMNNYKPELNPWTIIKNNPNFDMLKYGDLYRPSPEVVSNLQAIATDTTDTVSARIIVPENMAQDLNDEDNEDELVKQIMLLPSGGPIGQASVAEGTPDKVNSEPRLTAKP